MKRKWLAISFLLSTLLFITACGITQELDESLEVSKELNIIIGQQESIIKDLLKTVEKIEPSFNKDIDAKPKTGLFQDQEGDLYKNFNKRKELLDELLAGQKEVKKYQKEIKRISSKEAIDVDNDKLNLINSSLKIIENNYDSLILYMETGFEQEELLYENLPVDNLSEQGSIINRTYGSVTMVAEESISNMQYTSNLINKFIKQSSLDKK